MTTNWTPARRAKLAEVIGITPETHGDCFRLIPSGINGPPNQIEFNNARWIYEFPDPATREGDNVWLAPLMWWLTGKQLIPNLSGGGTIALANIDEFDCIQPLSTSSFTMALLMAAIAAGVPELVAIAEGEE